MIPAIQTLQDVVYLAAAQAQRGLQLYPPGDTKLGYFVTYRNLVRKAHWNACLLRYHFQLPSGTPILLHFQEHIDNVVWFWSVLFAGYVPSMSSPFTLDVTQRGRHIDHLNTLLGNPPWITRHQLLPNFGSRQKGPGSIHTVEQLEAVENGVAPDILEDFNTSPQDTAVLVFTSGSTGFCKAVCLTHEQIIAAIRGKICGLRLGIAEPDVFLGWVGLDHVAGLVETHITAMLVGADQILVQATDLLHMPILFLRLLSQHKVTYSFAPNFFLARIQNAFEVHKDEVLCFDFSTLRCIASGGEANVFETCIAVNRLFRSRGARRNVVVPGFGMSETCAGAIFSIIKSDIPAPSHTLFAPVGICNPGIEMRITSLNTPGQIAAIGEVGQLELKGPIVFKQYYNNEAATVQAFTEDGWFITGDQGFTGAAGLTLSGRLSELLNINGVKYAPEQAEDAIASAQIQTVTPSYTLAFSHRPPNSPTESVCIVYLPTYEQNNIRARRETNTAIAQVVLKTMQAWPYVLPLDLFALQKSTLGKLSRSKVKKAFESGNYSTYQSFNDEPTFEELNGSDSALRAPKSATESTVLSDCNATFNELGCELHPETNLFQAGVSSIDLLRLKVSLQRSLGIREIPMVTIISNPTVRLLAAALEELHQPKCYDPVVVLQGHGEKTPLWLIHPGVGEVLIFLLLSRYFTDRPVYALRARGFEGEAYFQSIAEATKVYQTAIKKHQPHGPYAIAGYSYGSMLAFEISKRLTLDYGDEIKFLGSFNLPPHIKSRMEQLDWTEGLLNLAYFLELFNADTAQALSSELHQIPDRGNIIKAVVIHADAERLATLGLQHQSLLNWANLAFSLQSMARGYEPMGMVQNIDVFCAHPLAAVSKSREEWMKHHLSKWADFCSSTPRFHHVQGEHYTMISPQNVESFQVVLKEALQARGL